MKAASRNIELTLSSVVEIYTSSFHRDAGSLWVQRDTTITKSNITEPSAGTCKCGSSGFPPPYITLEKNIKSYDSTLCCCTNTSSCGLFCQQSRLQNGGFCSATSNKRDTNLACVLLMTYSELTNYQYSLPEEFLNFLIFNL